MANPFPSSPKFAFLVLPEAQHQMNEIVVYLESISPELSQRFYTAFHSDTANLRQKWAQGFHPVMDEAATLYYARPVFQHLLRISQRRRRSSSGTWRMFYDVADTDGDGQPDTLRIIAIRHAAARPLSVEGDEADE